MTKTSAKNLPHSCVQRNGEENKKIEKVSKFYPQGRKKVALHHTFHRARFLAKNAGLPVQKERSQEMWIWIAPVLLAILFLLVAGYVFLVTLSPEDKLAEDGEQEVWCRKHHTDSKSGR